MNGAVALYMDGTGPDDAVLTHVWFRMIKIVFGQL